MAKTSEVPVLIVGGGAVGAVLSMELARRGVEFRCIERMPGPARESRAIALHARTIELLERVDKRLSQRILDRDLWHKGYVIHFVRDGERSEVRPGLDYTSVRSRYNCIMAHNQSETARVTISARTPARHTYTDANPVTCTDTKPVITPVLNFNVRFWPKADPNLTQYLMI